jgi:hypothetical protein
MVRPAYPIRVLVSDMLSPFLAGFELRMWVLDCLTRVTKMSFADGD